MINKYFDRFDSREKGLISIIISCILCTVISVDLWLRMMFISGFMQHTVIRKYSFDILMEKYMFYGVIISIQIGWIYLYGDIERDFNKIIIISLALFILIDFQAVLNLMSCINSIF